jgi:hypothetical protein
MLSVGKEFIYKVAQVQVLPQQQYIFRPSILALQNNTGSANMCGWFRSLNLLLRETSQVVSKLPSDCTVLY